MSGWGNYFGKGYPRKSLRQVNRFVQERLVRHLKRRSQRSYRPPDGVHKGGPDPDALSGGRLR